MMELFKKNENLTSTTNLKMGTGIVHELIIPALKSPAFWRTLLVRGTLCFISYKAYTAYKFSFISHFYGVFNDGANQLLAKFGINSATKTYTIFDPVTGNKYIVEILKTMSKDSVNFNIQLPDGAEYSLIDRIRYLTNLILENSVEILQLYAQTYTMTENSLSFAVNIGNSLIINGSEISNGASQITNLLL